MELYVQKYRDIKTQADAVLHFLQNIDIGMLDSILEPNRTYQDFEKNVFIQKLGYALDEFIQSGDTFLHRFPGQCDSEFCNYKCKGFTFLGNKSRNYFDLIVDIKGGVVHDIYECGAFKCFDAAFARNRRIIINRLVLPFEE